MFSIKESLKQGWQKTKEHVELCLSTTLVLLVAGSLVGEGSGLGTFLLALALIVVTIIIRIGYTKIFLRIHDGESPRFIELFQEYKVFWRYLGVSILFPLAVLGGLILIIIPGFIWAVRFSFSPFIVVDMKIGPVAAMKESYAITKGQFWKIFGFWIVVALVNLLGLIIFGVGLLISIPLTTLAAVHVYRKLSEAKAGLIQTASPQVA